MADLWSAKRVMGKNRKADPFHEDLILEWGKLSREYNLIAKAVVSESQVTDEVYNEWKEQINTFRKRFNLVTYKTILHWNRDLWHRKGEQGDE